MGSSHHGRRATRAARGQVQLQVLSERGAQFGDLEQLLLQQVLSEHTAAAHGGEGGTSGQAAWRKETELLVVCW